MRIAMRQRFGHPKSPDDCRHGVIDRDSVASAVGKDAKVARAGARARFEIPNGLLLAQNRKERLAFPESRLATGASIGISGHDTEAVIDEFKIRFAIRAGAEGERIDIISNA